jgi:prephenate dehydrogenase
MGAGRMGAWLAEELSSNHEVAVFDIDRAKLKHLFGTARLLSLKEVADFQPELVINAVSLSHTLAAFDTILSRLPENCRLADIASVKTGLPEYYGRCGRPFVSSHPMFGPGSTNLRDLRDENAIIIKESDPEGKQFFYDLYEKLELNIHEYSFEEHDRTIAYSLSVPFASSMVFAACMTRQEAPGTTFRKHMNIALALLAEDDNLLSEIMFNPHALRQIDKISSRLALLSHIIRGRDYEEMQKFLNGLRNNIQQTQPGKKP